MLKYITIITTQNLMCIFSTSVLAGYGPHAFNPVTQKADTVRSILVQDQPSLLVCSRLVKAA